MCYNMKTVFILGKKKEEIMGTKAPYQTKQMKQILAYLQTIEGTHVTAADVCSYFKEQGINVGTTTVYRNLEKMVEQRLVAKYNVDGTSSACFEYLGAEEHCHLPVLCILHRFHKKPFCTDPCEIRDCPSGAAPV